MVINVCRGLHYSLCPVVTFKDRGKRHQPSCRRHQDLTGDTNSTGIFTYPRDHANRYRNPGGSAGGVGGARFPGGADLGGGDRDHRLADLYPVRGAAVWRPVSGSVAVHVADRPRAAGSRRRAMLLCGRSINCRTVEYRFPAGSSNCRLPADILTSGSGPTSATRMFWCNGFADRTSKTSPHGPVCWGARCCTGCCCS